MDHDGVDMEVLAPEPLLTGFIDQGSEPIGRILEAAEHCLSTSGYGGMSMRDIAKEAGVSKSLLHYHFQSKEHLFIELQIRVYNRLVSRIDEALAGRSASDEPGLSTLDAFFEVLSSIDDFPVQAELWARSIANRKIRDNLVRLWEHLHGVLVRAILDIVGSRISRLSISVASIADLLLASLTGLGLQASIDEHRDRVKRAFDSLRALLGGVLSYELPTPSG